MGCWGNPCNLPKMTPIVEDGIIKEIDVSSHKIAVEVPENLNWCSKKRVLPLNGHFKIIFA